MDKNREKQDNNLFNDFPATSGETWRAAVVESLRGKPFESLITHTEEGIDLPPMLRCEDTADLNHQCTFPGQPPYVRGTRAAGYLSQPWLIAQELAAPTPQAFNEALRHALSQGQTAVTIRLDAPTGNGRDPDHSQPGQVGRDGLSLATADDFALALQNIPVTNIPIFLYSSTNPLSLLALLIAAIQQEAGQTADLQGCVAADPLATLASKGTFPIPLEQAYDEMAQITKWAADHSPHLATLAVSSTGYHERGGSAVEELGFALATGVAYLRAMGERGVAVETAAHHLRFQFAIGSDFFIEVAKLRAARLLWTQIVAAFGGDEGAQQMRIDGRTAQRNKAASDPHINILRGTSEALAAVLGGVDTLHVAPFDEPIRPPDDFSRRIARNTQIILQAESHLTRLVDPAGGAYAVEYLTDQLGRRAWELFQEVERMGGMAAALQAGFPQARIEKLAEAREAKIESGELVQVGVNRYVNGEETPLAAVAPDYDQIYQERVAQLAAYRAKYDTAARQTALDALRQAEPEGSVEAAIEAAAVGATLSELTRAIRKKD